MTTSRAIFAGGCFWDLQASFENIPGIISTVIGYTGGAVPNPTHMEISGGRTGHAEAIEITYTPEKIAYETLLDIFFDSHDPTSLNRQGQYSGSQFRSAIFYVSEQQRTLAIKKINSLNAQGKYATPIVTEVSHAGIFYPAEVYHQHYRQKRPAVQNSPSPTK